MTNMSSISSNTMTMSPPTTAPAIAPASGAASTTFPSVVVKSVPSVLASMGLVGGLASMGLVGELAGIPNEVSNLNCAQL